MNSIHFVSREDLESDRYSIEDVVLPIPGASIEYPHNEMESIYHEIAQRDGVSLTESKHKVKDFSIEKVTGDYRKIVIKVPDLEHEILNYHESYETLLTSDLERMQEAGVEGSSVQDPVNEKDQKKRKLNEVEDEVRKRIRTEDQSEAPCEKQALKLKFKLPASCYATMAIRQLTKYSTSKLAQVAITNDEVE